MVSAVLATKECAYGRLVCEAATCRLSELRDIQFFDAIGSGGWRKFPFAALIGTIEDIPKPERQALTFFPRYYEMDVLTNILSRPFLLAVKGEETRATSSLKDRKDNWRDFIRGERVQRIAAKCR
jgi:hypothetical protein